MKLKLSIPLLILFLSLSALGQETICNDGLDNDNDGFIDCYDGDCSGDSACDNFFIDQDADCNISPGPVTFAIEEGQNAQNRNIPTRSMVVVGDVDGDGIVDIITPHQWDQDIKVISGVDGTNTYVRSTSDTKDKFQPELEVAIADIDRDGCSEIFTVERIKGPCKGNVFCGDFFIASYNCDLSVRNFRVSVGPYRPGLISLIDVDGDGLTEIYYKNEIMAAETGVILISGTGNWETEVNSGPVMADVVPSNPGSELVVGGDIYSVSNLTNRNTANSGSRTLLQSFPNYFVKDMGYTNYSSTSVADMNLDGNLDLLFSGATGSNGGPTTVFYWDVVNNIQSTYAPSNNWLWGTGRINLSDVDGDGGMNGTFITGNQLIALHLNAAGQLVETWVKTIEDSQSGIVGITVFDFDNDGVPELLFRDTRYLTIVNGSDGSTINAIVCQSHTLMEAPIVADVNGDGNTNIMIPCNSSDNFSSFDINAGLQQQGNGQTRVYEASGAEVWVPTRKVWNQHGYHVTNVNDDLTIPRVQQSQTTVFPGGACTNGTSFSPLNSFMNQTPILGLDGCPSLPAADLDFAALDEADPVTFIEITAPVCPGTDFLASFTITNTGDVAIAQTLFITFYNGDPTLSAAAIPLETVSYNISLSPLDSFVVTNQAISGPGAEFELFILLDDDGTNPLPLTLPIDPDDALECDYTNNLEGITVTPSPFLLDARVISDNEKCDISSPDNGEVEAYVIQGADSITAGYTFNWYNSAIPSGAPDFSGPIYSGLPGGTYSVYATHNAFGCSSDTVVLMVLEPPPAAPIVNITPVDSVTNCNVPNGSLSADVGGSTVGYDFQWFISSDLIDIVSVGAVATGLDAISYTVIVTDLSNGCRGFRSFTVANNLDIPILDAQVDADVLSCVDPNSGAASASVDVNGTPTTNGYTFNWYDGTAIKPTPDFVQSTYSGIPEGDYTVVAVNNITECASVPSAVTVRSITPTPVVIITENAAQTSCQAATPNGALSATADGVTAGFDFEWFLGPNTSPGNLVSSTFQATNLAAATYRLHVTNQTSGCDTIIDYPLLNVIALPPITAQVDAHQTSCIPNGIVSATAGGITAGFTFHWFNGNNGSPFIPSSDFQGPVYSNLLAGEYTVVAVDDATGCESGLMVVEVLDQAPKPVIVITQTALQTSCDLGNPNGALAATADGSIDETAYTFTWYEGQSTVTNVGTGATIGNLSAQIYTLHVLNNTTQCDTTAEFTVIENLVVPIPVIVVTDQTDCTPENGVLSANVGSNTSDYTFYWFNGSVGSPDISTADFTGPVYSGLAAGDYTLLAITDSTTCPSIPLVRTVGNLTATPDIVTTPVDLTSCLVNNGSISATADGTTTGYTFTWFRGQNTVTQIGTGPTINSLNNDIYTLLVVNTATGCDTTQEVTINDLRANPTVAATTVDQSTCVPPNGEGSANVAGITTNHRFYWFDGIVGGTPDTLAANFKGATYAGLLAGDYTVTAVDIVTGCQSPPLPVVIGDITVPPVISTTFTDQSACDPTLANGAASANVGGLTTGYNFTWFTGQNTLPGNQLATTDAVTGLSAGIYTVLAEDVATGCTDTTEVTISDVIVLPLANAIPTDQSNCNPVNGQGVADVGGATADHTFLWFNGNIATPNIAAPDFTGDTYTVLAAGEYTLVAIVDSTQCQSLPVVMTIANVTSPPVIATSFTDQTSCDTPALANGTATADVGGITAGFNFTWFTGQNTLPASQLATTNSITGLESGIYTILVEDIATGCTDTTEVTISDVTVDPVVIATPTDQTNCSPSNGQGVATVGGITADHTFLWFNGNIGTPDLSNPDFTGDTYAGLTAGDYTVVAIVDSTNCQSMATLMTIVDATTPPIISTTFTDQSSCDTPALANGTASADVGGVTTGFNFTWFTGQNTLLVNQLATTNSMNGLESGIYTILVEDIATGCTDTTEVTISDVTVDPIVTATPTAQTNCAPPNGQGVANVGGITVDHTFLWFNGNIPTPNISSPDFTGDTYVGLVAGDYTVVAIVDSTNCQSDPVFMTVADLSAPPAITTGFTDQTTCDPAALANGTAFANVGGLTAGFTFTWFTGQTTLAADQIGTSASISNLASGIYTVLVLDNITGCTDTEEVTITDVTVNPFVTATPTAQTNCDPADGQGTADVGGTTVGFTFLWFDGNIATPNISSPDFTGPLYTGLAAGDYTVVAINDATKCQSTPVPMTVANATAAPVITASSTPQTTCDPANLADGTVSADVGGITVGYTFTWFTGQNTTIAANQIGTTAIITGLSSGIYTVLVLETASGCINTEEATIINVTADPVVTATPTDQTACSPSNGQGVADVGGITAGFTFLWFDGNVATPTISSPDFTGDTYNGLVAGEYTVVAIDDVTKCESDPVVMTIVDATADPVITAVASPQSTCNPATLANGGLSADVGGVTAGFTFTWFSGQNTTIAANQVGTTPTVNGLPSGIYTVLVLETASGCTNTEEVTIMDVTTDPVVTATPTDQSNCNPANGEGSADVGGFTAGFTFHWFDGSIGTPDITNPDFTGNNYTGLSAGNYTVVAVDNATLCVSDPEVMTIADVSAPPAITVLSTEQTSCDPTGAPNGTVDANVLGATAGFNFTWFSGQNTLPANQVGVTNNVGNLAAGVYTVLVEDITTGCSDTEEVTITQNITLPLLDALASTDVTDCVADNGTVSATADGGQTVGYTFFWFIGTQSNPNITSPDFTGDTWTGRAAGNYTVVVRDDFKNCVSTENTIAVVENFPAITITPSIQNQPSDCNEFTGELRATASSIGNTLGFNFEWFAGNEDFTGAPLGNVTNTPGGAPTISDIISLESGIYTVRVTNLNNGCQDFIAVSLPFAGSHESVDAAIVPVDNCNAPNGSVQVNIISIPIGFDQTDYIITFYQGDNVNVDSLLITTNGALGGNTFTSLVPGNYTVLATQNFGGGCDAVPLTVNVADLRTYPDVVVAEDLTPTNCNGTGTGQLSASADGGMTIGYIFDWYDPGSTINGIADFTGSTYPGLSSGLYTLVTINNTSGCSDTTTYNLFDNFDIISITNVTVSNQDNCMPDNGTATIDAIAINGVSPQPFADFTISWFESDGISPVVDASPGTPESIESMAAGIYFVGASNNVTGCVSGLVQFEILADTLSPNVIIVQDNPNTNCTLPFNGQLSASVTEGATTGVTVGYSFEWFMGMNNTTPADALPAGNISGASGEIATGLSPGSYTVKVIDISPSSLGCETIASFDVTDVPDVITIASVDIAIANQDDCNPANGSAQVTDIQLNGASLGSTAGFTFQWFDNSATPQELPGSITIDTYNNLATGTYFVQATSTTSGCFSSLVQFDILEDTLSPNILLVQDAPNTNCTGAAPDGQLSASVSGNVTSDYTYEWFVGQNIVTTPLAGTKVSGASGEIAIELAPGFYTVRVTDNTSAGLGCQNTATLEVDDAPEVITIAGATIAIGNQNDCNPANGSATVTDINLDGTSQGSTAGFDFKWFETDGVTELPGSITGDTYLNLGAGTYLVQATSSTSGCFSSFVQFEVLPDTISPNVIIVQDAPNTNCTGPTPNGQLSASVSGNVLTDYSFEWFIGQNTTLAVDALPAGNIIGASGETATALAPGFYTVRVTDNTSAGLGCSSVATFEVDDAPEIITIAGAAITVSNQDDCNPANGSATVTDIQLDGVSLGTTAGYDFKWFDQDGITELPGPVTTNSYTDLAVGSYFVQATSNTSSCFSSLVQFEILPDTISPQVVIVQDIPNTNCTGSTPNGQISASVTEGATTGVLIGYTFEWFNGQNNTNPGDAVVAANISGANGQIVTETSAGFYTVRVIDTNPAGLGCETISTFEVTDIPDNVTIISAEIMITNQDDCNPANGAAEITQVRVNNIPQAVAGFTFKWFESDGINELPGSVTTETYTDLAVGTYFVQATSTASNCISSLVQFNILPDTISPQVVIVQDTPNTNCSGSTPNGQISASVTEGATSGVIAGYTFEWFTGQNNTTPADVVPAANIGGASGQIVTAVEAGFYTVKIIDTNPSGLGCETIATFEVDDVPELITIISAEITVSNQNDCDPENGTAEVTQVRVNNVPQAVAGFTFQWFESDGMTELAGAIVGPNYNSLGVGTYFVQAMRTSSSCLSTLVQFDILPDTIVPNVILVQDSPNTNCAGSAFTGQLSASVSGNVLTDYTFEWFTGQNTTLAADALALGQITGGSGEIATALEPGFYTVRATDNTSAGLGCQSIATLEVDDIPEIITIASADITLTNQDDCDPSNGTVEVTQVLVDGTPQLVTGFTFNWFLADGISVLADPSPATTTIIEGLATGSYFVQAISMTSNCLSSLVEFRILEDTIVPQIVLIEDMPNTTCVGTAFNGQLSVSVTEGATTGVLAGYDFEWFIGQNNTSNALPGINISGGNGEIATALQPGFYTVRVLDNNPSSLGCQSIATIEVRDIPEVITINSVDLVISNQDDCAPANGTVEVTQVTVDGVGQVVGGFDFVWFDEDGVTPIPDLTPATPAMLEGLATGSYFVQATSTTSSCFTSLIQFEMLEDTVPPFVMVELTAPNTTCDISAPNGVLTANILIGGVIQNPADYMITWFDGRNTTNPADMLTVSNVNPVNPEVAFDLATGFYTVVIQNTTQPGLNCQTVSVAEMLPAPEIITLSQADIILTENTHCTIPNGQAEITQILVNGIGEPPANFTFLWFEEDGVTAVVDPDPLTENILEGRIANKYVVQATSNSSTCFTSLVEFRITEDLVSPIVSITLDAVDSSCDPDPAVGLGALSATADGGQTVGYTFEWYEGTTAGTGPILNLVGSNNVVDLPAGDYTVRSILDATQCFTDAPFNLPERQEESFPFIAGMDVQPLTDCDPPNGRIEITNVLVGGGPAALGDQTYVWYNDVFDMANIRPETGTFIENLTAGTYFVELTNTASSCESIVREILIEDVTNPPEITLLSFTNPTQCDGLNIRGELSVSANGSTSSAEYLFEWYVGTFPVTGTPIAGANSTLSDQDAGTYTVVVTDNSSPSQGCENSATYTLETQIFPINISVSSTSQTSCEESNGSVSAFATVTNNDLSTFIYTWWEGTDTSGTPIPGNNATVTELGPGFYTAIAVDATDPTCVSEPQTIQILENIDIVTLAITQDATVTTCEGILPNGQLSAFINGNITSGYSFYWFRGPVVVPGDTISVGNTLGQEAGTFTVIAVDDLTGCFISETATIETSFITPPSPDIEVISEKTSCLEFDGKLKATVEGETKDHIFDWYLGENVTGVPLFTGAVIGNLDAGTYTVVARDRLTNCPSGVATVDITDTTFPPEVDFLIKNEDCGLKNGQIQMISLNDLAFRSVEWEYLGNSRGEGGGRLIAGPQVDDAEEGSYTVVVIGSNGCSITETVEVKIDIFEFNGISRNGDGVNDVFQINCIELIPENNVKIFNRNGTLVYEADFYDNGLISFDGVSNKGINLIGKELPDGTYFYVIDPRNGTEPIAGYLELLR